MMKSIFTSFLVLSILTSFGQNIPNGDFEEWDKNDHFKLNGYYTHNFFTKRVTDAKSGKYAMRLENGIYENGNIWKGYAYTIDYLNNEFDGYPFEGDVLSMVFWAKHDLAPGDTARVYAVFRYQGSYKGAVNFYYSGSTNDQYVKYSVPITWNGPRTPDSVWVYFYSTHNNDVDGPGYTIIDDFHFENIGQRAEENVHNGDFEIWDNIGTIEPKGWLSVDSRYQRFYNYISEDKGVIKSNDAYSGNNSLAITNYRRYNNDNIYSGYAYPGQRNTDYYRPAFPIDEKFTHMQGYYKYIPAGIDSAIIRLRTFQGPAQTSYDEFWFDPTSEWTYFNIPLSYYSESSEPDSAAFIFYSGYTDSLSGFGTTLFLDALEFTSTPHTSSISNVEMETTVYPNPTTGDLKISSSSNAELTIINPIGQVIKTERITAGQNKISLSELPSGPYSLLFKTKDNQWQTKIMKL